MGDQLALRPVGEDDLPVVEELTLDPETAGEFAQFGWFDPLLWRRRWAENGLISHDAGTLMVVHGQDRLGFVVWRHRKTTPAAYCIEMGIALLPEARGHGYGTQAHRLLARYLLAHTTVHRIEAATKLPTSRSRRPWSTPDSRGKALCAAADGGTVRGATGSPTACSAPIRPCDRRDPGSPGSARA